MGLGVAQGSTVLSVYVNEAVTLQPHYAEGNVTQCFQLAVITEQVAGEVTP
jgi:hypothetical protein